MSPPIRNRGIAWKPLAICPNPDLRSRLARALSEFGIQPVTLPAYPAGATALLPEAGACNICFLDAASDPETAQALIARFSAEFPVVVLHASADADLILRCLRRGASEFLAEPTTDALRAVFERFSRVHAPPARAAGQIYCVLPAKPGCGASTIAAHLAISLRRAGSARVLVVDADALYASIAFILKLKPEFHLEDVRRDWNRMDEDLWARLILSASGVDVLAAPDDPSTRLVIKSDFAAALCAFWRERYETVVIDLPGMPAAVESGLTALADMVFLVTTNELAALQAATRSLRLLDSAGGDRNRLRLILNRYTTATGLQRDEVAKALSLEPFACVANDYDVIQAALLEGRPAPSSSRFAVSIDALCRQLRPVAPAVNGNRSWVDSLLRRKPVVSR